MVFVTTTWCGWCKKLAEENFNDPEVKKLLEENFVCVIVDGDTEKETAKKFGVRGFPHIIFQSQQGDVLEECKGYRPVDKFKPLVEQALAQVK
jgi:thioredoxin-related protein